VISPGGGGRGERTARMLTGFERTLLDERPGLVVLAGDFDATLACALAAAKLGIPVAHVEAGLRDWDWGSPAEINRVLTDQLSDALFCHGLAAADNLRSEGVGEGRIHLVGSTVVDWLRSATATARRSEMRKALGLAAHAYVLVALHKRATVDGPGRAARLSEGLVRLGEHAPLLVPSPGRTSDALSELPLSARRLGPLGFRDFMALAGEAGAIVTDSGSVQEEASAMGVPCYTLRATTERQVTLTHGTNTLVDDPADLAFVRPSHHPPTPCVIPMWDGHASARVADALIANFALRSGTGTGTRP
jgi:UDP-N-acetylglucosamine 2-epimerase (non-hydrolysing)